MNEEHVISEKQKKIKENRVPWILREEEQKNEELQVRPLHFTQEKLGKK